MLQRVSYGWVVSYGRPTVRWKGSMPWQASVFIPRLPRTQPHVLVHTCFPHKCLYTTQAHGLFLLSTRARGHACRGGQALPNSTVLGAEPLGCLLVAPDVTPASLGSGSAWRAPVSAAFEILYFSASGAVVRSIRLVETSGYNALPWVRYMTSAGTYHGLLPEW